MTPTPNPTGATVALRADDTHGAWQQLLDRFTCHLDGQRDYLDRVAAGDDGVVAPGAFDPGAELPPVPADLRHRLLALRAENEELQLLSHALLATIVSATQVGPVRRDAGGVGGRLLDRAL